MKIRTSTLYKNCRIFDLSVEIFHSSFFKKQRMHQLSKFVEISFRINCFFYQFISRSFRVNFVFFDDFKKNRIQNIWKKIARDSFNAFLNMYLYRNNEKLNKIQFDFRIITNDNASFFENEKFINKFFIDVNFVKNWIHRC